MTINKKHSRHLFKTIESKNQEKKIKLFPLQKMMKLNNSFGFFNKTLIFISNKNFEMSLDLFLK